MPFRAWKSSATEGKTARRVLVVSSEVPQPQLVIGAAREDVSVVLYDWSSTSLVRVLFRIL
jgi:hypothetical protein